NGSSGTGAVSDTIDRKSVVEGKSYNDRVQIGAAATGNLVNTVTTTAANDTNTANNSVTDTDTLTPRNDVSVGKTDNGSTAVPGSATTYTIVVSNSGPSTATNGSVSDPLAAGVSAASWSGTNGSSGTGAVSDTISSLAPGATVTYTDTVQIGAAATGNLRTEEHTSALHARMELECRLPD